MKHLLLILLLGGMTGAQVNLALNRPVTVSSEYNAEYVAVNAVDGKVSDASRWLSAAESPSWIRIALADRFHVGGIHFYSGYNETDAVEGCSVTFVDSSGTWQSIPSAVITGNKSIGVSMPFDAAVDVITDTLMVTITRTKSDIARVHEITVWEYDPDGLPMLGTGVTGYHVPPPDTIPPVYVNQSGYNLGKPKRFTAPLLPDGTVFTVTEEGDTAALYTGSITGGTGDFTAFDPGRNRNYVVRAGGTTSFPFRIGHWWLERVTYQNAVNFMIDSRHYVGNYTDVCSGSFGWRDDHHFGWELHTLVPQFLSHPAAYIRMPNQVSYSAPADGKWGALDPYDEGTPDIVKLIHWGADIIVTQGLTHEHLKAQLAYFLYAWPHLEQWLPAQNYTTVRDYAFSVWQNTAADRGYPYDESAGHNLLTVKTKLGSTKGPLPPGANLLPNLLMYEAARDAGRSDSAVYFDAAYDQAA